MKTWNWLLLACLGALSCTTALAQRSPILVPRQLPPDVTPAVPLSQCGPFTGFFGPIDFRTADPRDRRVVEEYHFDMELQTWLSGQVSGRNMAGTGGVVFGFQYTLKSLPNHPVALLVMDQVSRKLKSEHPQGIEIPVECWYLRAMMTVPNDPVVRALYGVYLAYRGRNAEALANLNMAVPATASAPNIQHQIGLAYIQLKQYELAQLCALRMKRANYQLDAVERQLKEAGKWNPNLQLPAAETAPPPEDAASAPEPAASAASAPGT